MVWVLRYNQDQTRHASFSQSTNRLFIPDILLYHPLHPLILGAHILTCSHRRDGIGKGARLVWIRDKASFDGVCTLSIASSGELSGVTFVAPSVSHEGMEETHRLVSICPATSTLRDARRMRLDRSALVLGHICGRAKRASSSLRRSLSRRLPKAIPCSSRSSEMVWSRSVAVDSTARPRRASPSGRSWRHAAATASTSSNALTSHRRHGRQCGGVYTSTACVIIVSR